MTFADNKIITQEKNTAITTPSRMIQVPCQNCHKEMVWIDKNSCYFGILCSKCSKPNIYTCKEK
jgi:hypothetical protein